jgi:hypothetical protein
MKDLECPLLDKLCALRRLADRGRREKLLLAEVEKLEIQQRRYEALRDAAEDAGEEAEWAWYEHCAMEASCRGGHIWVDIIHPKDSQEFDDLCDWLIRDGKFVEPWGDASIEDSARKAMADFAERGRSLKWSEH